MNGKNQAPETLTLQLLDSAQGHPIQSWNFSDCTRITIGRGADNDICLSDPQVSRMHAELVFRDENWWLHSHGRNGTHINNELISEYVLTDRTIFQLGVGGSSFRYVVEKQAPSATATIDNIDPGALDFLRIDEKRKEEELESLTESQSFKELQEQARRFRNSGGQQ